MKGITNYGVSLPYYRIKRETILEAMGWFNPGLAALKSGEKAVANHDEDSLTLAVAAGQSCFSDVDRSGIDALYLASTTLPYQERSNAGIALGALNLPPECMTAEFGAEVKCGVTALTSALSKEDDNSALVCASDCRLGKSGGVIIQAEDGSLSAVSPETAEAHLKAMPKERRALYEDG